MIWRCRVWEVEVCVLVKVPLVLSKAGMHGVFDTMMEEMARMKRMARMARMKSMNRMKNTMAVLTSKIAYLFLLRRLVDLTGHTLMSAADSEFSQQQMRGILSCSLEIPQWSGSDVRGLLSSSSFVIRVSCQMVPSSAVKARVSPP